MDGYIILFDEEVPEIFWNDGVASVYVWGYELVSDLLVFLYDTLVFYADLVIDNLEVDLVASQSDVVHYEVVGSNAILVLLGIEGGNNNFVGVEMVGVQDVLVTAASSDEEASSVIYVKLGYRFFPNVHLV